MTSPASNTVRVVIRVDDIHKGRTLDYGIWETYVYGKLKEAGIPVSPTGDVERGTLFRYDDPEDFGATIWKWEP